MYFLVSLDLTLDYFLIFQPEDMLNLCLDFHESQPTYAHKRYAYTKEECITTIRCTTNIKFI